MGHLVTFDKVNNWLLEKDEYEVVGITNNADACPMRTFVLETNPTIAEAVLQPRGRFEDGSYNSGADVFYRRTNGNYYEQALPLWAARAMFAVDSEGDTVIRDITAGLMHAIIWESMFKPEPDKDA